MKPISFLFSTFVLLVTVSAAFADDSFEGQKGFVARSAYKLFGGQVETLATDDSGVVYAGLLSPNGIYCSTDNGTTWSTPALGTDLGDVHSVAPEPDGTAVFVVAGISLFRSNDNCVTWTKVSAIDANYAFDVVFSHETLLVVNRNGTIDRSTDEGDHLAHVSIATGVTNVEQIAASPTDGEFYLLGTGGGVTTLYRSSDSGATWSATTKSGSFKTVAVDPTDSQHIVVGNGMLSVDETRDGGATWSTLTTPPPGNTNFAFTGGKLFIGQIYTADDGATWHDIHNESTSQTPLRSLFAGDPNDPNQLYAASGRGLAVSTDGGATWTDSVQGMFGVTINDIAQAKGKQTVYLATGQGLAKTTNFLDPNPTWEFPVSLGITDSTTSLYSVLIDHADANVIYLGAAGGNVYRSNDAGTTWTQVNAQVGGGFMRSLAQAADGTIYGGYALAQDPSGAVFKSADGTTWTDISAGTFNAAVNAVATIGNNVFAGLGSDQNNNGADQVGLWKYNGTSWSRVSGTISGRPVDTLLAINKTLLAGTTPLNGVSGTIFRSADSGATWAPAVSAGLKTDNGFYRTLAVDPKNSDSVYAAQGNPAGVETIYQSGDNGITWNLVYTGLTDEVPSAMLVDGLLGGANTGLFEFTKTKSTLALSYDSRKRQISCTLEAGRSVIRSQYVNLMVKSLKTRNAVYTRSARALTSSKGVVTFSSKKIAKKTSVFCAWTEVKSKAKNF